MPVLFCNIAWMEFYAGRSDDDPPLGGGGFPVREGYCGEECNFVPCQDGYVYGHFETIKKDIDREVKIQRLGARVRDEYIDGVDIVWTAPTRGNDPRTVVGWSRNARLYRHRQQFNGNYPSDTHLADNIRSYRVRAPREDVVLLEVNERTMDLERGAGWSGQASWWYAENSTSSNAIEFVGKVVEAMKAGTVPSITSSSRNRRAGKSGRSGAAAQNAYQRYLKNNEVTVHPLHDRLQKKFAKFLRKRNADIEFLKCYRDDLRYCVGGETAVMVEVKPTEPATIRFAIRTAISQLLDYRQHQKWHDRQLIVVGTEVSNVDDVELAHANGFGLAWPSQGGFTVSWPT